MIRIPVPRVVLFAAAILLLQQSGKGARSSSGPAEGSIAPVFDLAVPESKARVKLDELRKSKPVALVFGSYT
ncbi:MAG: hypothetical protein HY286_13435 [Planctomycetes bacterium]|nr:hypothetical protein [Planctomycetota bacterium]